MQPYESSSSGFLHYLAKNGALNTHTYSINSMEARNSQHLRSSQQQEEHPIDPSSRRVPNFFNLNSPTENRQPHAQIPRRSKEHKHSFPMSPSPTEAVSSHHTNGVKSMAQQLISEREAKRGRREIPIFNETLRVSGRLGEERTSLADKRSPDLDTSKRDSASRVSFPKSPEGRPPKKKMSGGQGVANSVPVFAHKESLHKDSFKDEQKEAEEYYQKRAQELEKRLDDMIEARSAVERENIELKDKVNKLMMESEKKSDQITSMGKKYRIDAAGYELERGEFLDKLKALEEKHTQELLGIMAEKNRLESETLNYIDQIADFEEKRSRLVQENINLKDEMNCQELKIQSFGKNHESLRKAAEVLKSKKESHIMAELELKETLKSTLEDLALAAEKAMQIETDHVKIVQELEKQLSQKLVEKDYSIENMKKKYEQELDFKNHEIDELKKRNNRLVLEKENAMKSMMIKAKEEPAISSAHKYASLEVQSPKVSVSTTRNSEVATSTAKNHFAYNIYNIKAPVVNRESYTIDDGKEPRVSRQAKPQHERYRDHSNYFQTETSKERSNSSSRRINTEPINDLKGRYQREEYVIPNNVASEPSLKKTKIFEVALPNQRNPSFKGSFEGRTSTTKGDTDLANYRTPPFKDGRYYNDVETNKKAPVFLKARLTNENQSTYRFDKTLKNNDSGIRGDRFSKITTHSFNESIDFKETLKHKERGLTQERVLQPIDNNIASIDIGARTVKHSAGPKNINLLHVKSADLKTFGILNA